VGIWTEHICCQSLLSHCPPKDYSSKTFFDLLPNIMQANASYFVTDPKGQTLPMAGGLLEERSYRVLAFDTIDFTKSLHYNPIAYVEDEADILELVGCLIANTSGDDRHAADPFWENAERLLYVALIGYLVKPCPREDRSLSGVVTLLSLARQGDGRGLREPARPPLL